MDVKSAREADDDADYFLVVGKLKVSFKKKIGFLKKIKTKEFFDIQNLGEPIPT